MLKILVWIAVVFAVLFGLRLLNMASARKRRADQAVKGTTAPTPAPMVRCARCGVFLPQADAKRVATGFVCGDPSCAARH